MNSIEKKAKFVESLKTFHNSEKTSDEYMSFIGKCAWVLSSGTALSWVDIEDALKEAGIPRTN